MGTADPETKNDYAGEGQQQFILPIVPPRLDYRKVNFARYWVLQQDY